MKSSALSISAVLCAAISTPALAAWQYSIKPLASSGASDVFANGVNTSGQIVGYVVDQDGISHGMLWNAATGAGQPLADLSTNQTSEAYRINNAGQIVGKAGVEGGSNHAALWTVGKGGVTDIGVISGGGFSFAMDINDNGVVAGSSGAAHGQHAFTWTADGGIIDNGSPAPNSNTGFAGWNAINNDGLLIGTSYILFSPYKASIGHIGDTQPTYMSPPGQFSQGMGFAVNNSGVMVGYQNPDGHGSPHAAIFDGLGGAEDLGTLGETDSWANDVNEDGLIVGKSFGGDPDTGELISKAFIYQDHQMIELRTLLENPDGWTTIFEANAVSDNGLIVGTGVYNGQITGFVLSAVPEPASAGVLGICGAALLARRRRFGA